MYTMGVSAKLCLEAGEDWIPLAPFAWTPCYEDDGE